MDAIDLFAGAGGFTTGATAAGVRVVYAANHWRAAVDAHAANHPDVTHACQDPHQADWHKLPRHDLLLASPSCLELREPSSRRAPARRRQHRHLPPGEGSTAPDPRPWADLLASGDHKRIECAERVAFLDWKDSRLRGGTRWTDPRVGKGPKCPPAVRRPWTPPATAEPTNGT